MIQLLEVSQGTGLPEDQPAVGPYVHWGNHATGPDLLSCLIFTTQDHSVEGVCRARCQLHVCKGLVAYEGPQVSCVLMKSFSATLKESFIVEMHCILIFKEYLNNSGSCCQSGYYNVTANSCLSIITSLYLAASLIKSTS